MKRAIFPNSKLLQPMPVPNGEHANISGNANNATQNSPAVSNAPTNAQNNSSVLQNPSAKNGNEFPFFAPSIVIFLLIILVVIFIYRKYKKK
jgi:hypothetical protein